MGEPDARNYIDVGTRRCAVRQLQCPILPADGTSVQLKPCELRRLHRVAYDEDIARSTLRAQRDLDRRRSTWTPSTINPAKTLPLSNAAPTIPGSLFPSGLIALN